MSPPEILVVKRGTTWARNGRSILLENARLPRYIQGYFTCRKSTPWDKRLYFPSEGRRVEDFFALKSPTASAGFGPANLGTKGQHATSGPPKPLVYALYYRCSAHNSFNIRAVCGFVSSRMCSCVFRQAFTDVSNGIRFLHREAPLSARRIAWSA